MNGDRFNPWRRLRDLGDEWRLLWRSDLPHDVYGYTHFASRTIVMRKGMSFAERRCTIAHEVEHVQRGRFSRCSILREEADVDRRVSRLLLPDIATVADALIFHHGRHDDAADELWVDPWTLEVRLGSLDATDASYLQVRLAEMWLQLP